MKMKVELKSDWLITQIELLKSIYGYEMSEVNQELGSIDYVTSGDGREKKLLRVVIDQGVNISKANTDTIRTTIEFLENEGYDEALILAEEVTQGAKSLLRKKKEINYISNSMDRQYSIIELLDAIQKITRKLCKLRCGKIPKTKKDCKGYQDSGYSCPIRRVSDDADFHAERRWMQLMVNDFSKLISLQRKMNE